MKHALLFISLSVSLTAVCGAVPSFTKEPGIRLSSAAPQAVILSTNSIYRMYFIRDYEVYSATSSDQLDWTVEPGVRLSSSVPSVFSGTSPITGCDFLSLDAGGYRMVYSVGVGTGPFGVFIATSADGMAFGTPSVSTAVFISTGGTFVGSPRLTEVTGGSWRLFYIQDANGGNEVSDKGIYTSLSSDEGVSWSTTTLVTGPAGDIALSTRTDQLLRLFYTAPLTGDTTNSTVVSGLSNSGVTSFSAETSVRLSTDAADGPLSSLAVARSTETFRYRLFYNFTAVGSTNPSSVFSAITASPDPQSISPSTVLNSASATSFTISGEIFSSTPTAKLTKTGQTDITGTGLTRVSDQSLTVSFNPFAAEIGTWNVSVTNDDSVSGSASDALIITFAPAEVTMTDNLLRPGRGPNTTIDVDIFSAGRITVKLYSMDGRLIRTLFDQEQPTGTTSFSWDGTNLEGSTVASGVYLLKFSGPKLNMEKKVVVIR